MGGVVAMIRVLLIIVITALAVSGTAIADTDTASCDKGYSLDKVWNSFKGDYYAGMEELAIDVTNFFSVSCVRDGLSKPEREEFFKAQIEGVLKAERGYSIVSARDTKTVAKFAIDVSPVGPTDIEQGVGLCHVRYTLRLGYEHQSTPPWGGEPRHGFNEIASSEGFGAVPHSCVESSIAEAVDEVTLFLNWLPSSGEQDFWDYRRNSIEN